MAVKFKPYLQSHRVTFANTFMGTKFRIYLRAVNEIGHTDSSIVSTVLSDVPAKPSAVPTTDLAKTTKDRIFVQYTAPASDGGSDIETYEVQMDDGKGGDFVSLVGGPNSTDYLKLWFLVEKNVTKGTLYRFRYRTRNSIGWSEFSDNAFILAANVPAKPPTPKFTSSDSTSVTLSFSFSDDDGGSPITRHKLFRDAGNDFTSTFVPVSNYLGIADSYSVTVTPDGLVAGRIYRFVFVATNALGDSEYSNELIAGVGAKPPKPDAPLKNYQESNETSSLIYWNRVTTSELPLSGYILYMDEGLGGPLVPIYDGSLNPALVEYRVDNMIAGRTYTYKVRVIDYNGQGTDSDEVEYV